MTLPELLSDPVRARIYTEVLLNKEITAQELLTIVNIQRSTLSHHLSRFVKEGVLKVRVQSTGRSVKYYSLNPDYSEKIIETGEGPSSMRKRIAFLESASAYLQVISHLINARAEAMKSLTPKSRRKTGNSVTFTFNLLTNKQAKVWNEEYLDFEKRVTERCAQITNEDDQSSIDFIAFCGLAPTEY